LRPTCRRKRAKASTPRKSRDFADQSLIRSSTGSSSIAGTSLVRKFCPRIHLTRSPLLRNNPYLGIGSNCVRIVVWLLTLTVWGISVNTNVDEFTVPEKILLAADGLDKQGQSPFSPEALIVASWQKFPKTFGLKGYVELYPDSNKILSSIMGEKGLARRGWLVKMGQKMYALTREGRHVVRKVMMEEEEPAPAGTTHRMGRDHERFLKVLLDSTAVKKFEDNRKGDLAFADACR